MSASPAKLGYHVMAQSYDVFFTSHREWFKQTRHNLLSDILPKAQSVCDIGCGTGYTAIDLASQGLKVFAADVSSTMCKLARDNSRRAQVPIHVLQSDMRSFKLPEKVDIVLAEFDVLNHLPEKSDLEIVAKTVRNALVPGGYFYFDVNTKKVFQTLWPQAYFIEKQDMIFVPHGGYDPVRDKGWLISDYFIRDGNRWRRVSERLEEVCWEPDEIQATFERAGFSLLRTVDSTEMKLNGKIITQPGCIVFYLFQKVGSNEN